MLGELAAGIVIDGFLSRTLPVGLAGKFLRAGSEFVASGEISLLGEGLSPSEDPVKEAIWAAFLGGGSGLLTGPARQLEPFDIIKDYDSFLVVINELVEFKR